MLRYNSVADVDSTNAGAIYGAPLRTLFYAYFSPENPLKGAVYEILKIGQVPETDIIILTKTLEK